MMVLLSPSPQVAMGMGGGGVMNGKEKAPNTPLGSSHHPYGIQPFGNLFATDGYVDGGG